MYKNYTNIEIMWQKWYIGKSNTDLAIILNNYRFN